MLGVFKPTPAGELLIRWNEVQLTFLKRNN